jgi:hypothetical protein
MDNLMRAHVESLDTARLVAAYVQALCCGTCRECELTPDECRDVPDCCQ